MINGVIWYSIVYTILVFVDMQYNVVYCILRYYAILSFGIVG